MLTTGIYSAVVYIVLYTNLLHQVSSARPNILLIVADDMGWNDIGFHGSEIKTPNLDSLAYEGVILNNYYVSPICTPTRGSLMTGRHPIHLGLQSYVIRAPQPYGLPLKHKTMAEHFRRLGYAAHIVGKHYVIAASEPWGLPLNHTIMAQHFKQLGYKTHIVGKWHLGFFQSEYLPINRGFDSHYGYWGGKIDYFNHEDIDRYKGLDFRSDLTVINKTSYSTELYTAAALKVIDEHDTSEPLFLYMAHQAVHAGNADAPLQAPQEYIDRFPYITNLRRRTFAGMVAALDDSVGSVVEKLAARGMLHNTIIVFSTDNGGPANNYDGNAACNFPLRGTKNTLWEGGIHGVGFIHSKLLEQPQTVSNNLMYVSDWLPTLYSAAGGNVKDLGQIDGIDMWNMLKTGGNPLRKEILHNIDPKRKRYALRAGDYKIIGGDQSGNRDDSWYSCTPPTSECIDCSVGVKERLWVGEFQVYSSMQKKMRTRDSPFVQSPIILHCGDKPVNISTDCIPLEKPCLFNIIADPCEYYNLADKYPDIVKQLLKKIDHYSKTAVDPVNKPSDPKSNPKYHNNIWVPWLDF